MKASADLTERVRPKSIEWNSAARAKGKLLGKGRGAWKSTENSGRPPGRNGAETGNGLLRDAHESGDWADVGH